MTINETGIRSPVRYTVLSGAAAGDLTLTGIKVGDVLLSVLFFAGAGVDVTDLSDLTAEFSITAADTINNGGGTATTGGKVLVIWFDDPTL